MKRIIVLFACVLGLVGCGGSLSDEQRKKLREGMESQKIQQTSDSEIVTAALERGRIAFQELEKEKFDQTKASVLASKFKMKIRWIIPGSSSALDVENQLIQAYVIGAETGSTQDNIQKVHRQGEDSYDSLLYSRPIVTPQPDGSVNVKGVWNLYMSKKDVILGIGK
ncbi:MAG: hypothetical protein ABJA70_07405 [Chryseolinea sp.]